jgi:hypothetical protein
MHMKIRRVALAGALVALTTAPVLAEEAVDTLAREDAIEAQVDAETANQNALQAQQDAAQAQGNAAQAQQGVSDVAGELHGLAARVAALEAALAGLPPPPTMPDTDIDCSVVGGETIADVQYAIDNAVGPTTITITGTCIGDLMIKRDDITLQGDDLLGTDGIQGRVFIEGARRTVFSNMTISGGASGITAYDGAVLRAKNVTVTGTTAPYGHGIGSYLGAVVVLTDVDVDVNAGTGVETSNNGTVDIREGSEINNSDIGNDGFAVGAYNGSFVRISGDVAVHSTDGYGVFVSGSAVRIQKDSSGNPSITSVNDTAVFIHRGSNARIEDATIDSTNARALMIHSGSSASVRRTTISSGYSVETVLVVKGSTIELSDNTISNDTSPGDGTGSGTAVQVVNDSSIAFNSTGVGNTLTTGGTAVGVNFASHVQQNGDHDTFNGQIDIFGNSSAEFRDAAINGNMFASQDSWLRLRNGTTSSRTIVTGNIEVEADSLLSFKIPSGGPLVQVTGFVNCIDGESSVAGDSKAAVAGGLTCTGF